MQQQPVHQQKRGINKVNKVSIGIEPGITSNDLMNFRKYW